MLLGLPLWTNAQSNFRWGCAAGCVHPSVMMRRQSSPVGSREATAEPWAVCSRIHSCVISEPEFGLPSAECQPSPLIRPYLFLCWTLGRTVFPVCLVTWRSLVGKGRTEKQPLQKTISSHMQWGILTWRSGIALNVLHRSYPMSLRSSVGEWSTELLLGLAKRMGCGEDPPAVFGDR